MPVVNTQINETTTITENGTYDVARYTTAVVDTPAAPDYYMEYTKDASGKASKGSHLMDFSQFTDVNGYAFYYTYSNTAVTGNVSFSALTTVSGQYGCGYMFQNCTGLTSVDLSSLTTISGSNGCSGMFQGCTRLTSRLDLSSLTTVGGNYGCSSMFSGCTGLTSVDLSGVTTLSGSYCFANMFENCTSLTSVDLSNLETITAGNALAYMFKGCSSLTSLSFPKLRTVSGSTVVQGLLSNSGVTKISFPALTTFGSGECFAYIWSGGVGATTLIEFPVLETLNGNNQDYGHALYKMGVPDNITTTIKFQSLKKLSPNNTSATRYIFYSLANSRTNPTVIYFYALDTSLFGSTANSTKYFNYMLIYEKNATVHFPMRTQSVLSTWTDVINGFGGTNTTVLFDIVTSITGADTNVYARQEKDSTDTATAWVLNNVLYYTSGTTEPVVGTTIYSDAGCTTAVTTVSSIA